MKDTRQARLWTLTGVVALAAAAGFLSVRRLESRMAAPGAETLRDAVASPVSAAPMPGKPAASIWFKSPAALSAEADDALMASRRRRARAHAAPRVRAVALQ